MTNINKQLLKHHWDGKIYIVGGAVRDEILGFKSKDVDYLVTKISINDLSNKLKEVLPNAKINEVGKSFGIIKVQIEDDEYDFSIPRSDVDRNIVTTDPNISIEEDLKRRDFTINALAKDIETGEIIYPVGYNGIKDLKNKIIRTVGTPKDRFNEDPLRMLRAIQFATRFNLNIEKETLDSIISLKKLLLKVSKERFEEEFRKALTKGIDSSIFFNLLETTGIGKLLFGEDFNPIIIPINKTYEVQLINMFLNSSTKSIEHIKNTFLTKSFDKELLNVSLLIYSQLEITSELIKKLNKNYDKFDLLTEIFKEYNYFLNIIKKPLIFKKKRDSIRKSYELPITGGDIIERYKIKEGKHINEILIELIKMFQNNTIPLYGDIKENSFKFIDNMINKIV